MIHRAAERVEVAPAVDLLAGRLLGRHVVDRPDGDPVGRRERAVGVGLHQDAEAEVEHLDGPVVREQEVRRLDVAVDDPLAVGVGQPQGRLAGVVGHVHRGHRPAGPEPLAEALAGDELHDDIEDLADLVGVERPDDVRVVEHPDEFHLALEAGDDAGVRDDLGGDDLERDRPAHQLMLGLVDPAHRPRADPIEDDVPGDGQAVRLVGEEPLDLIGGEDPLLDESIGQCFGLERVVAAEHLGLELIELAIGEDARLADDGQEVVRRFPCGPGLVGGRHGSLPKRTSDFDAIARLRDVGRLPVRLKDITIADLWPVRKFAVRGSRFAAGGGGRRSGKDG